MQIFKLKHTKNKLVRFKKFELNKIMSIYSEKISIGEWKDYSICFQSNYALFCIHKSFNLHPSFQIMKKNNKGINYYLSSNNQLIIKSNSLNKVLSYFNKPILKLVR